LFFFFFSSRRRHTRFSRDWSSDVCSSDLQVRDWLFVEDHARALLKVVTEGVVGETYNIGGHNEQKNIDVVRSICALLEELAPEQIGRASCRERGRSAGGAGGVKEKKEEKK